MNQIKLIKFINSFMTIFKRHVLVFKSGLNKYNINHLRGPVSQSALVPV